MNEQQTVFMVDDDPGLRTAMAMILDQAGFRVEAFGSAQAFLEAYSTGEEGCLLLDLRMPGMTGIELQEALMEKGFELPIIFLSAFGDIPTTVRAVKGGAVDFLEKPVDRETLIQRVTQALEQDRRQRQSAAEAQLTRAQFATLSPREREVMALATQGLPNKEIARHLGISPRTVENHRARLMEKMQAENIAELCHKAAICLPGDGEPAA